MRRYGALALLFTPVTKAGLYKVFLQFKRTSVDDVITAPFVVRVTQM